MAFALLGIGVITPTTVNAAPWKSISGSSCQAGVFSFANDVTATDGYGIRKTTAADSNFDNWVYCPLEIDTHSIANIKVFLYYTKKPGSNMSCYLYTEAWNGIGGQYSYLSTPVGDNVYTSGIIPTRSYGRVNLWCAFNKRYDAIKLANYRLQ